MALTHIVTSLEVTNLVSLIIPTEYVSMDTFHVTMYSF